MQEQQQPCSVGSEGWIIIRAPTTRFASSHALEWRQTKRLPDQHACKEIHTYVPFPSSISITFTCLCDLFCIFKGERKSLRAPWTCDWNKGWSIFQLRLKTSCVLSGRRCSRHALCTDDPPSKKPLQCSGSSAGQRARCVNLKRSLDAMEEFIWGNSKMCITDWKWDWAVLIRRRPSPFQGWETFFFRKQRKKNKQLRYLWLIQRWLWLMKTNSCPQNPSHLRKTPP